MKVRMAAGAVLLFSSGCLSVGPGCNFDDCKNDFECGEKQICEQSFGLGRECQDAEVCSNGNECSGGETCVPRAAEPAGNPFRSATANKGVCQCVGSFSCNGNGGYGGAGGSGGYGGYIDVGGGGAGGAPMFCAKGAPSGAVISGDALGDGDGLGPAALALGARGERVIALSFKGALDLPGGGLVSAGDYDIAVMAETSTGEVAWARSFGDGAEQLATAVVLRDGITVVAASLKGSIDVGTGPLVAGANNAAVVFALGPTGETLWARLLAGTGDVRVAALAMAPSGDSVSLGGSFEGGLTFDGSEIASSGGLDGLGLTLSLETGALQGGALVMGAGDQEVSSIAHDADGSLVMGGSFNGESTFLGGPGPSQGTDAFVMKWSPDGQAQWARLVVGPERQVVNGIAIDPAGDVLVAGTRGSLLQSGSGIDFGEGLLPGVGLVDTFVAKLSGKSGGVQWSRLFGGPADVGQAVPSGVVVDCAGAVTVAGSAADGADFGGGALTSAGGLDAFVFKLDSDGEPLWSRLGGGSGDDQVTAVAIVPGAAEAGALQVGGLFSGAADFGAGELVSQGPSDLFVVRYEP